MDYMQQLQVRFGVDRGPHWGWTITDNVGAERIFASAIEVGRIYERQSEAETARDAMLARLHNAYLERTCAPTKVTLTVETRCGEVETFALPVPHRRYLRNEAGLATREIGDRYYMGDVHPRFAGLRVTTTYGELWEIHAEVTVEFDDGQVFSHGRNYSTDMEY